MDDLPHVVEVDLGGVDAASPDSEFVARAAEESCHSLNAADGGSFVMITTEVRGGRMVKLVRFETRDAADRFRDRIDRAGV